MLLCSSHRTAGDGGNVTEEIKSDRMSTGIHTHSLVYIDTSLCVRKSTSWIPTRPDTNQAVQSQKMVRGWKYWI